MEQLPSSSSTIRGLPLLNQLLQHTLRSLCKSELSQNSTASWVYAIFWRILPRNYPPPKWETEGGPYDRSKGSKRNWILVWEDGYCNFTACRQRRNTEGIKDPGDHPPVKVEEATPDNDADFLSTALEPQLFFKMSHDVYNYGEGLMGKVAADNGHRWIFRDPPEQHDSKVPLLPPWQASIDSYPRTWEAQFKAGIQTIALIGVGEGLLQLGSTQKVEQDAEFAQVLQRKFSYLQSIPGVFAQHPNVGLPNNGPSYTNKEAAEYHKSVLKHQQLGGLKRRAPDSDDDACSSYPNTLPHLATLPPHPNTTVTIPAMYNSLQALLSKLPAVITPTKEATGGATKRLQGPDLQMACPPILGMWADSRQASGFLHPATPSSDQLSDEFEAYHSLFGQLIS